MSGPSSQMAILDATVISNYAISESVDYLVDVVPYPRTVPAVREELQRGYDEGYSFLEDPVNRIMGSFTAHQAAEEREVSKYDIGKIIIIGGWDVKRNDIKEQLDQGEAQALYTALIRGFVLATDDRDARDLAREHNVPVTGSLGILVRGIKQDKVTVSVANEWLGDWIEAGYYSPVEDVRELLE